MRVAVVGSGPSGLAALQAFQAAAMQGVQIPELVCFERQAEWGGLWNYTWRTGLDEHGEPVHGSMYRYLWSNAPKECLEYPDYSFEAHFGKPIPSYPPRAVLYDYIKGRAQKAGVRHWIRFNTPVRMVEWDAQRQQFRVTAHERVADRVYSEWFDRVIIATGHFSTPRAPEFEGIRTFNGRVLHAHDFRDALEFKDQDVLIVGRSFSAEDIGAQCWKYGARSITTSYRTRPMGYKWPERFEERPLLQRVVGRTAHFKDGTRKDVDAIILCTGYQHHFPFLPDELRLKTENRLWPLKLYRGVVWEDNPGLSYLGMQDQFYSLLMFDAQARFARDVILGRIQLPEQAAMHADSARWRAREEGLETIEQQIAFQGATLHELIQATDYPAFDIDAMNRTFMEWVRHKAENIMGFRDNSYRSVITGTMQPLHHTPWFAQMDDSMADYLKTS